MFGSSYEWVVVTKKLGRSSEADLVAYAESGALVETTSIQRSSSDSCLSELSKLGAAKKAGKTKRNRLYRTEIALAFILLAASVRSLLSAQGIHFYFLLFQGLTFVIVGLDSIGEQNIAEHKTSLVVPFLRLGEKVTGGPHFPLTADALKKVFTGQASQEVFLSIGNALLGWLVATPFSFIVLYVVLLPCFKILVSKFASVASTPKTPSNLETELKSKPRAA